MFHSKEGKIWGDLRCGLQIICTHRDRQTDRQTHARQSLIACKTKKKSMKKKQNNMKCHNKTQGTRKQ